MTKRLMLILLMLTFAFLAGMNIDDTISAIALEREALEKDAQLCETRIAELRSTDPDFAPQDMFESDKVYLSRICTAAPKIIALKQQFINPHWAKLDSLRSITAITEDVEVEFSDYDANKQECTMYVYSNKYKYIHYDVVEQMTPEFARFAFTYPDSIKVTAQASVSVHYDMVAFDIVYLESARYDRIGVFIAAEMINAGLDSVSFSDDGRFIAYDLGDNGPNTVTVSDSASYIYRDYYPEPVKCTALSPDGRYLAVGVSAVADKKTDLWVYDLRKRQFLFEVIIPGGVLSADFSPDGRLLAIGGGFSFTDSMARIYEVETGKMLFDFSAYQCISQVMFSPNQRYVASIGISLEVWDLLTLEKHLEESSSNYISTMDFHPDSNILVIGGNYIGYKFYDLAERKLCSVGQSKHQTVSLSYNYKGNLLAIGTDELNILDLTTNQFIRYYKTSAGGLFKPGSDWVISRNRPYKVF